METETPTIPLTINGACGPYVIEVTLAELARITQVAYDQHGILAQPWTAVEAEKVERPANLPGDSNGHLRRMLETGA